MLTLLHVKLKITIQLKKGITVNTAYKTHEYKILIRLKIAWNGPDVSKYILKSRFKT